MNIGQPIIIEKVDNGFIVRPLREPNTVFTFSDFNVFQDMGYASASRNYQKTEDTLLGFIYYHFSNVERIENKKD